jgi:preprotein translocase subunit YajC
MHWNVIFADAAVPAASSAATGATSASGTGATQSSPIWGNQLILFLLLGIAMYFALFRPQQQRAKQQAKLLANLKSGDKVATSSGIVGVVITVKDKTVSLRSADAKMEVTKASVTEILESSDAQTSP